MDTTGRRYWYAEQRTLAAPADLAGLVGLTGREAEVLFWVAQGRANRDIATILGLRPPTVRKHLEHIYQKLNVENRTAAVARAQELLGMESMR